MCYNFKKYVTILLGGITIEDKNIIYNKTNDNITPIDTSAKDFAFEADTAKARRQMEERARVMNQPIDTSAKDFALKAELEKAKRALLEEQQAMYQDIDVTHKTR